MEPTFVTSAFKRFTNGGSAPTDADFDPESGSYFDNLELDPKSGSYFEDPDLDSDDDLNPNSDDDPDLKFVPDSDQISTSALTSAPTQAQISI
ncbi:unnamed protein product [Prunus armeniaca]